MNRQLQLCGVVSLLFCTAALLAMAHPELSEEEAAALDAAFEPIANGLPASQVAISVRGDKRIVESNEIPNHETGEFPNRGNPNAIAPQHVHYEVPLHPVQAPAIAEMRRMDFGVALNGVKFDPATAGFWNNDRSSIWNTEAIVKGGRSLGIDWSNAHVQPNGAYHYHGIPHGLIRQLHGEGKMTLVGWAADGFPIYGPLAYKEPKNAGSPLVEMKSSYRLKSGMRPGGANAPSGPYDGSYTADFEYAPGLGTLDECNGRFGVTPEHPEGIYYYVLTEDFPFVPRKFRGVPDESFRHLPPPGGPMDPRHPGQGFPLPPPPPPPGFW